MKLRVQCWGLCFSLNKIIFISQFVKLNYFAFIKLEPKFKIKEQMRFDDDTDYENVVDDDDN